jgi:lipopolysaccharide transport system permease protein
MADNKEYIIDAQPRSGLNWKDLWHYRELFFFFTWRDIKVRYKHTVLGILWILIQPLMAVAVFSLFFGRALNIKPEGMPYPIFAYSGLLFWTIFSTSVSGGGNSMISNAPVIKKIYFPRIIIPVSAILGTLIDFCVSFAVFVGVLIAFQMKVSIIYFSLLLPLSLFLTLIASLGVTSLLAALIVKYKDFRHVVPFGLQIALFITPVIYPTTLLNSNLEYLLALNPMYAPITLFRSALASQPLDVGMIGLSILSSCILLAVGILYFQKTEAFFADIA